jgi:hypothetical protein
LFPGFLRLRDLFAHGVRNDYDFQNIFFACISDFTNVLRVCTVELIYGGGRGEFVSGELLSVDTKESFSAQQKFWMIV